MLDISKITSRLLKEGRPVTSSCGEDCVHNEGGCFRARWPFLKDDRLPPRPGEGCTSNVAARVWGNASLRHLQACEIESLKERCTVQLRSVADGGPIVVCCCTSKRRVFRRSSPKPSSGRVSSGRRRRTNKFVGFCIFRFLLTSKQAFSTRGM
ncbi:hypothetical protein L596_009612 [Steinernema carpocapsae]|uniref:Uncharacterized protein n=1 Tax=Steinernema carpocapsae TaxID=34508 RepID=A0A4U5PH63_STECR|nr:hypothetical protein L596_009612 [Steinernema carpocapsae]